MHWKATQDLVEEGERYLGLAFLCDHHVSIMRSGDGRQRGSERTF
jgi:hypothetical protein